MRLAVIAPLLLILLLLGLSSAPVATAQALVVKPGGVYTIYVKVHKPAHVRLPERSWEVRVYFYEGTNCYNTGSWWQSGAEWIYSGWYEHRYIGDEWYGEPQDKTLTITATLVGNPREEEDITHGMNNIPVPGSISLRARLVIKDIGAEFTPIGDGGSGYVTFTIAGISYQYQYTQDEYGDITITGEDFEADINERSYEPGVYDLRIDQTIGISVSDDAPSTNVFQMPSPINVNLISSSQVEPSLDLPFELKVAIGIVTVMVVVGGVAYLGFRGRKPAEEELPAA